jgi:PAS domain S-box-containing protein
MSQNVRTRARSRSANPPSLKPAAMEELISDISASLVDLTVDSAHARITQAFERLLRLLKLDRLALWEFKADREEFVLLHCRQSIGTPFPPPRTDAKHFRWAIPSLLAAEPIVIQAAEEFPEAAVEMREYFKEQGIRSWIALPLRNHGVVFGALVFVAIRRAADWNPRLAIRLQTIADIVGSALARVRAEQGWRQSESLRDSLLSSPGNSLVVVDGHGLVIAVNPELTQSASDQSKFSGGPVSEGMNYLEFWRRGRDAGQPDKERAFAAIQSVLEGSADSAEVEYSSRAAGQQRWFRMIVKALDSPGGGAVINHTDITALKQAEAKLSESEARFGKMTDEAPLVIWMHGPDKNLTYINKAGLRYSGLPEQAYLGRNWRDHIYHEDLRRVWRAYEKAFDSRQELTIEYRHLHVSGRYRWLLSCGGPRFLADGTFAGYIGVSVDIHDRKEAQEGRLQMAGRLLRAQEEERSRIGRDLHDDFAQRLALMAIRLHDVEQAAEGFNRKRIADLRKEVNRLSVDLAQFSHRLHSSYLDNYGLAVAVKNQCKEVSRLHQIDIACDVRDLPSNVPKEIALTLFRVLQEALHNAVKHSHGTRITTRLFGDGAEIRLQVADNGVGFIPGAPNVSSGLGLVSMKERLQLVGGDLLIKSQPRLGTEVEARVPLGIRQKREASGASCNPQHTHVA